MAEDRIDVVVDDKVDNGVEKKLRAIATSADKGATSVQKLKSALADIDVSSVTKLQRALTANTNALARELNASTRLEAQRSRNAIADAKAATEAQRLATETARTEAAQIRAATAAAALARSELALAAAQAKATASAGSAAMSTNGLGDAVSTAKAQFEAGELSIRKYVAAIQQANAASAVGGGAAPGLGPQLDQMPKQLDATDKAAKRLGATNANILAQFNDLGVQFSMAAASSKPLQGVMMALIQQGSQLAYIASTTEGGWRGIAASAGALLLKLAPLLVVVGALYLAFNSLAQALTKDSGLDKMGKEAGLTRDELKKLGDTSVTVSDVIQASFEVMGENIMSSLGFTTDEAKKLFSDLGSKAILYMKAAFVGIAGFARVLVQSFLVMGRNIQTIFHNAGVGAANLFIMAIQKIYNGSVGIINKVAEGLNAAFGTNIAPIEKMDVGVKNLTDGMRELEGFHPLDEFQKGAQNSLDMLNRIGDRAKDIRREANQKKINEIIADRNEKKTPKGREDKTAENRAHALDIVNLKLDDELSRMKLLKDERAIQQRMDQIEEQLAQKKIRLNDAERASVLEKVKAIEAYKYVQSELDRIYEDATGPARTLNAATEAATQLFDAGKISVQQYNAELNKAGRAYSESTDPLFAMNEAVDTALKTTKLYGTELERANYLESIRQQYLDRGLDLYDQSTGKLNAEVAALIAKNDQLRLQQQLQATIGEIVNPMLADQKTLENKAAFYAEIDRLRQQDVLSEEQAQRAKYALDARFNEMRLAGMSSFFGELASLSSSGNKKLAAIGKAAAVVQATIDGYVAFNKALASAPPPWNYALAGAVAVKAGAQVAGILSTNVGSFATGGQFMVDGRSGVDQNNINMNVSRGERVTIETPAQQRANEEGGNAAVQVSAPKIVNMFDEKSFIGAMDSEDGEEVIMNIIRRRGSDVNQMLGTK